MAGSLSKRSIIIAWIDRRLPVFTVLSRELDECPAPRNLNYLWNFGSIAAIVLVVMIVSCVVLSRLAAAYYFLHFVLILPIVGLFEGPRALPVSLRQNVLTAASPGALGGNR